MEVKRQSYTLKFYDCYRPQHAVDQCILGAQDLKDTRMKAAFEPNIDKSKLIPKDYIAEKSGHSRGSTVDLNLVPLPVPRQGAYTFRTPLTDNSLAMASPFDLSDAKSHTVTSLIIETELQNRLLRLVVMGKQSFKHLPEEWWHCTLRKKSYPQTYFNFSDRQMSQDEPKLG